MTAIERREWQREHQHFERGWWGTCVNTYGEETKQIAYARVMGLDAGPWQAGNPWPIYNVAGAQILDVGGGPVSMLLKCSHLGRGSVVVDPCRYPKWTAQRYREHRVALEVATAEDYLEAHTGRRFDEAWIYNVLQHTIDPEAIIAGMRRVARRIRVFEWVETEAYRGHPHTLHVADLQAWCGGEGTSLLLDEIYKPVEPATDAALDPWRIEQHAWGGVFES